MSYAFRRWSAPVDGDEYVIGGDPAEGLERGDDTVLQGISVKTGEQVFEIQGKIEPLAMGELAYHVGTHYHGALIGIENNKDGGANRTLFNAGYRNIYFHVNNRGEAYDVATPKLGINTNAANRLQMIALARKLMADGSVTPRSQQLIAQLELFEFNGTRFEAVPGAHDDLVMAWVLACYLFWVRLQSAVTALEPMLDGEPMDPDGWEDIDRPAPR